MKHCPDQLSIFHYSLLISSFHVSADFSCSSGITISLLTESYKMFPFVSLSVAVLWAGIHLHLFLTGLSESSVQFKKLNWNLFGHMNILVYLQMYFQKRSPEFELLMEDKQHLQSTITQLGGMFHLNIKNVNKSTSNSEIQ